jgi:hypothetical protein
VVSVRYIDSTGADGSARIPHYRRHAFAGPDWRAGDLRDLDNHVNRNVPVEDFRVEARVRFSSYSVIE